jgi:hypothetical protein
MKYSLSFPIYLIRIDGHALWRYRKIAIVSLSEPGKRRMTDGQGRLMATQIVFHPLPPGAPQVGRAGRWNVFRSLALLIGLFLCTIPARAQLQQPFVFSADPANPKSVAVYTRNDLTGILTPVPGSPFPSKEPVNVMTLDFKGRFLFTASYNPSKISMFIVDPNTGILQEVSNSPFASASTNQPVFLSTESSGQFLYVINFNGSQPNVSSVESFQIQIDPVSPVLSDLSPSLSGATQLPGLFLSGASHPSGKSFYAILNAPNASIPNEAFFLLFDSSTGKFTIPNPNMSSSAGTFGCCSALNPQGKNLALGVSSQLTLYSLQADGTLAPNSATGSANGEALSMAFDTFGRFLYVDFPKPATTSTSVHIFSPATLLETSPPCLRTSHLRARGSLIRRRRSFTPIRFIRLIRKQGFQAPSFRRVPSLNRQSSASHPVLSPSWAPLLS